MRATNPYHMPPQCQLKPTTMNNTEIERRSRLLRAQVGDVLVKENIFGELYVSFKASYAKHMVHIFENENLTDFEPPIVVEERSAQNYLYVIYNGKSPHAVRSTLRDAGYITCCRTSPRFNIYWGIVQGPRFYQGLAPGQLANSFPGQTWFTYKNKLASTVNEYQHRTGVQGIIPRSFKLQEERDALLRHMEEHPDQFFIYKPIQSSRGANIELLTHGSVVPERDAIAQEYLTSPLLLRGYKFDLRTYVLLFQVEPLTVYIYNEGIGRFCTEKYETPTLENFRNHRVHLTNFEVNRFNTEEQRVLYVGETDESQIVDLEPGFKSKQSLSEVLDMLDRERDAFRSLEGLRVPEQTQPGDGAVRAALWEAIEENVRHIMVAAEPYLHYRADECGLLYRYPRRNYALYGFDHIIDDTGHVRCLEINVLPSMETTTLFDHRLKFPLLQNTFELVQPVVELRNDELVIPTTQEFRGAMRPRFSAKQITWGQDIVWESLTPIEQRAILEVTEAEKRCGDFRRLLPAPGAPGAGYFEHRRYLNELLDAWIYQNGV